MASLKDQINKLSPDLQKEVKDFVDFLLKKQRRKKAKPLKQDWAGALKEYRHKYSSLELQKKALEWRSDR